MEPISPTTPVDTKFNAKNNREKKRRELLKQSQKDHKENYDIDGVSSDEDFDVIISSEKPEPNNPKH